MAKVVDIKAAYQRKVLASLDADFKDALSEAAECRLKIGLTLDEAAEVVPSALSPENAADHAELVRGLLEELLYGYAVAPREPR